MAQKLWDVWRGNCGTWRRNYGILHTVRVSRFMSGRDMWNGTTTPPTIVAAGYNPILHVPTCAVERDPDCVSVPYDLTSPTGAPRETSRSRMVIASAQ